ncbi:MAG: hypothetical protein ACI83O_000423 [Patescibacteria group bacterium]|jgi:hypothetical protein
MTKKEYSKMALTYNMLVGGISGTAHGIIGGAKATLALPNTLASGNSLEKFVDTLINENNNIPEKARKVTYSGMRVFATTLIPLAAVYQVAVNYQETGDPLIPTLLAGTNLIAGAYQIMKLVTDR